MERRKALLLLAMLPVMLSSYAQSKMNTVYNIYLTKVQYSYSEPKTTLVGALAAVVDVATSNNLTRQMSEYVPSVGTAVKSAVPKVPYLCVKEGNLPAQPTPADYQLDTEVTSIGVSTTYKDKKDEKNGFVKATLILKNLASGKIVSTQDFSRQYIASSYDGSGEKALSSAIGALTEDVNTYFWQLFPLSGSVLQASEVKGDKVKSVFIDLGNADGAYKSQHFRIVQIGSVCGRETRKEIARLKLTEIQGPNVSECKVTKGGENIKPILDAGGKLTVESVAHQSFW